MNEIKVSINRNGLLSKKITFKILNNGYDRFQWTCARYRHFHKWKVAKIRGRRHRATLQNYKATWTSLLTNEKAKSTFTRRLLRPPMWALMFFSNKIGQRNFERKKAYSVILRQTFNVSSIWNIICKILQGSHYLQIRGRSDEQGEEVDNKAMERLLENLSIPKSDNADFQSGNRGIIMLLSVSNSPIGKQFEMCLNFRGKRLWQSILEFGGIVTSQEDGPN